MEAIGFIQQGGSVVCGTEWLTCATFQRQQISDDVRRAFHGGHDSNQDDEDGDVEDPFSLVPVNRLELHALHRRRRYLACAGNLSRGAEGHSLYQLLMWCHDHHVFIHPSVEIRRHTSTFRDHAFFVTEDVPRLTPLLAIPESILIGFRAVSARDVDDENNLYDAERERQFNALNVGADSEDADICQFFFRSLGMIVADLITARSSPVTDARHAFADLLSRTRTLQNAPYFDDGVVFDPDEPCLADVLLQMIRNYINGGPLVNKIPRADLQWAVSVCLSHATPLALGANRSIGIIPLVHLFPHGGAATNSYVIARTARESSTNRLTRFFRQQFGYDFSTMNEGKWVYVVPAQNLHAGDEIRLQSMAPVCDKDNAAEQMWRLSCGSAPPDHQTTSEVARRQLQLTEEIMMLGAETE